MDEKFDSHETLPKVLHPGLSEQEYQRISFVASNSLMGVIYTMVFDPNQQHTNEELAVELKTMLIAYFRQRIEMAKAQSAVALIDKP